MFRTVLFAVGIVFFVCSTCFSQDTLPPSSDRVPVLVELFTSEGCSSCPPADRFIQSLDTQPVPGIEIIVLSEHVDYWNHQGWSDPYSSPEFSERQRVYAQQFKLADVYTPQLVVDGAKQMSGSNIKEAVSALQEARTQPKIALTIAGTMADRGRLRIHIESAPFGELQERRALEVYVLTALNHAESNVTRGENANHHLVHAAVVRKVMQVGKLRAGERLSRDIELKVDGNTDPGNLRVVAYLQDPQSRKILGAAMKQVDQHQAGPANSSPASNGPSQ